MLRSPVPVRTPALLFLCAVPVLSLDTLSIQAQTTSTWQAPGVASWNDPANWTAGVPNLAGDHAIFEPSFPTADALVVVIDPTTTIGTLTYDNLFQIDLTAPTMTFDGDGINALVDILSGQVVFSSGNYILATDLDLSVAAGTTAMVGVGFNPPVSFSGPGGINVQGGGEVILNGSNTYQGATHIQGGTLRVHHNNSLGAGSGIDLDGTFIHSGGKLEIASESIRLPDEKIIVDGGTLTGQQMTLDGPVQLNSGTISGTGWTINGPFTAAGGILTSSGWSITGPTTLTGVLTARGTGQFAGDIDGPGGLQTDGAANIQLLGDNTYTGHTTVTETLTARTDTALGAGTGTDADGTTVLTGGQLVLTGSNPANEKFILAGGTLSGGGIVGGPVVLNDGTVNGRITFDGPMQFNGGTVSGNVILNGPIDLTADTTIEAGADFINGGTVVRSVVSGAGGLIIEGGPGEAVQFFSSNHYAGQTVVENGATLVIFDDSALGSGTGTDADATIINVGGILNPVSVTLANEKIILNGGILGRSANVGSGPDPIHINSPIELTADSTIRGEDRTNRILHINGIISGAGNLRIGSATLNNANTYVGETTIIEDEFLISPGSGSGIVTANHPNSFGAIPNKLTLEGGTLFVAAPITVSELVMDGGGLNGTGTLTVGPGGLTAHSGNIFLSDTGVVVGVTQVNKKTDGLFDLGFIGTLPDPVVNVERGVFLLRLNQRVFDAPITLSESHAVFATVGGKITGQINLQNSTGYAYGGVLQNFSNFSDMAGPVMLGDVGAIISSGRGQLRLSGDITGGALTLSRGKLLFSSEKASYAGPTTVGLDGRETELVIRDQGRMNSTSEIVINRGGTVITGHERIGDSIPITLAGGMLEVRRLSEDITTETVGHITAAPGDSILRVHSLSDTQPTSLLIGSFDRQPGSVVTFSENGYGDLGGLGQGDPGIIYNPQPVLSDGLIGGWAVVESSGVGLDFATYSLTTARGVHALGLAGRPDQAEGASAADNVRGEGQPDALTGDRTINSLVWNAAPSSELNLGGHTLNVDSGGVLRTGGMLDIVNGSLTAGGVQPDSELIIIDPVFSTTHIQADIVDNPTGKVSLVKSSIGTLVLLGNNTYTGSTTVNEGVLRFMNPGAIPDQTDLAVNGGIVQFQFDHGSPIRLGTIHLRHIGILSSNLSGSVVPLDAQAYLIDSGIIDIPLSGGGTLTKNTFGRLNFGADSPGYHGDVIINNGLVTLESETTLGTSHITINGGFVNVFSSPIANQLTLAGGTLASGRGQSGNSLSPLMIRGSVDVTADSTFVLYAQPNARDDTRIFIAEAFNTNMEVFGPISIASGVTLKRIGGGTLNIRGNLGIGNASRLDAVDGTTLIQGVISANDSVSSLNLLGSGEVEIRASLDVGLDNQLTLYRDGNPLELSVNGVNKTVTGRGVLGNDLTLGPSATLKPGNSTGELTIDGDYTQLLNAILQIELGGAADGLFDVLAVTGVFDAGGTFEVLLIDGFLPRAGDRFAVLDFASVVPASRFDQYVLPQLGSGLEWDTTDLLMTGELRVVPEPSGLLWAMAGLALMRRR